MSAPALSSVSVAYRSNKSVPDRICHCTNELDRVVIVGGSNPCSPSWRSGRREALSGAVAAPFRDREIRRRSRRCVEESRPSKTAQMLCMAEPQQARPATRRAVGRNNKKAPREAGLFYLWRARKDGFRPLAFTPAGRTSCVLRGWRRWSNHPYYCRRFEPFRAQK